MKNKKIYILLATIIMLVGIIVAFTCELNTSGIYDPDISRFTDDIGTHVCVIMLFVLVSAFFLYLFYRNKTENMVNTRHYCFLGGYLISGLFFSIASGYQARATNFSNFYSSINSAPSWYASEFTSSDYFHQIPGVASDFSSSATIWYILMAVAVVITVVLAKRASSD